MTIPVIRHDGERVMGFRWEADHEYEPASDEFIPDEDSLDLRNLDLARVDISGSSPVLEYKEATAFNRPGVTDRDTRELISAEYRAAGSDAIQAEQAIRSNANIPQEVKDYAFAVNQMLYLLYVTLTGDRIQSVEDEYWGGS